MIHCHYNNGDATTTTPPPNKRNKPHTMPNPTATITQLTEQITKAWNKLPGYTANIVPLEEQLEDADTSIIGATDPNGYNISAMLMLLNWDDTDPNFIADPPDTTETENTTEPIRHILLGANTPGSMPAGPEISTHNNTLRSLVQSAIQVAADAGITLIEAESWGTGYDAHYTLGAIDQALSLIIAYTEGQHPDQSNPITKWDQTWPTEE